MADAEIAPLSEIERLQMERDALGAEVAQLRRRGERRNRLRGVAVVVLVAVAVVSFTAAVPAAWARRNLLDTDRFVSRVAPLAEDPAVQEALTVRLTNDLMVIIDPQALFEEALPDRGSILAVPLANAVQGFVQDAVGSFVASDRFAQLWEAAARVAHRASSSVLRGRSDGVLTVEDGQVPLNLVPVVEAVLDQIRSASPEILGREIDLPDLSVEDVPATAIARLEDALDIDLDDDFGQVLVYDDATLGAAQQGVRLLDRSVFVLVPLSVLTAAAALWLSDRRRRTLLQIAGGTAVGMVLVRRVAFAVEDDIASLPPTATGQDAAAAAADSFLDPLTTFTAWMLAAAGIVVVAAALTADRPWAVSLRQRARETGQAVVSAADDRSRDQATVAWVTTHRDSLLVAGLLVALIVVWITDLSWFGLAVVVGLVAAFEAVVYRMSTSSLPPPGDVTHDVAGAQLGK